MVVESTPVMSDEVRCVCRPSVLCVGQHIGATLQFFAWVYGHGCKAASGAGEVALP